MGSQVPVQIVPGVYIPKQDANAQIAINNVIATIGRGDIYFDDADYVCSGPINWVPGIRMFGVPPTWNNSGNSNTLDDSRVFKSGTRFLGDYTGNYDCFTANNTDLGSPPVGFSNTAVSNVHLRDCAIEGFRYPIKVGGVNNPGLFGSSLHNIWLTKNTMPLELHNFSRLDLSNLFCTDQTDGVDGGMRFVSSVAQGTFIPGKSVFKQFQVHRRYLKNRGLRFEALAGCNLQGIEANKLEVSAYYQAAFTQNATYTSGSANITVTDGTQYLVGYAVVPTATQYGFIAGWTYFVTSVVGNVITLSNRINGLTNVLATGSGTVTNGLKTGGFPCMTMAAFDGVATGIDSCHFLGVTLAGSPSGSGTGIVAQSLYNSTIGMSSILGGFENHLVIHGSTTSSVHASTSNLSTDFDDAAYLTHYIGNGRGTINNRRGWGTWDGHQNGEENMSVARGADAQLGGPTGQAVIAYGPGFIYTNANSLFGQIQISTGGSAITAGGLLATVTTANAKEWFIVSFSAQNAAAQGIIGSCHQNYDYRTNSFDLICDTALAINTVYNIVYKSI